ncbi:MAG TPA: phosphomannomutase [Candidatus Saccharimonadales bacterium]|nr:phosphomannomutase [Candidatus Saccharimonadales bacterium]
MAQLQQALQYEPVKLAFGTSGLRGLAKDMTDLECYINARGFLNFLIEVEGLAAGSTVYMGGDLRESTPRILRAVQQAISDAGFTAVYAGLLPTPALAFYAQQKHAACIMVTGSHIPADRNGIKFYKQAGEVLKDDEPNINEAVTAVREQLYVQDEAESAFDTQGMLKSPPTVVQEVAEAKEWYTQRYTSIFGGLLNGLHLVFYQHSAVGRDLLPEILEGLGATVTCVDRSDIFVPIDTENVTVADQAHFRKIAAEHPDCFAIVSTDGDSDRPFVIDATGTFHRGDVLGAVTAAWLNADFAAYPVSASDATDTFLRSKNIPHEHTKIGSPFVILAMQNELEGGKTRVVGWEVNGGVLLGSDFAIGSGTLEKLPTRDALLPIIAALAAAKQGDMSVAEVFASLPQRATQAGLINDFPVAVSAAIKQQFADDTPKNRQELSRFFTAEKGFGAITKINSLDGIRMYFDSGDIAHIRPSSNAPQLRIYSVADTQERADEIVAMAIAEPDGIFRQIEQHLS